MSDGPRLNTGFSSQTLNILNGLSDNGFDCHYLSHSDQGLTLKPGVKLMDGTEFKFHLHGAALRPYCDDIIESKIKELNADIFGVLLDTFMLHPSHQGANYLTKDFSPAKPLFYFPSDGGEGLPVYCEQILKKFETAVAMSKFAQQQAKEVHGLNTLYIPHGVNVDMFKPLSFEERQVLKQKWGLQNKFVIGSVYRNQPRKSADRLLRSFAKAKDQMPNAVLLLHTDPWDPASAFSHFELINRLRLNNRVLFTGMRYFKGFTYQQMNEVYNLMDTFALSTTGEGFGIPTIEAMSCEIPCLVTDYTTTKELIVDHKAGEGIRVNDEIMGGWMVNRGIMDINDGAEKLIKFYKDAKLREEYGKNGRKAVLKEYDWKVIHPQWADLMRRL